MMKAGCSARSRACVPAYMRVSLPRLVAPEVALGWRSAIPPVEPDGHAGAQRHPPRLSGMLGSPTAAVNRSDRPRDGPTRRVTSGIHRLQAPGTIVHGFA